MPTADRPDPRTTLVDVVRRHAVEAPERPLYTWLDEAGGEAAALGRGELDRRARALAVRLAALGRGERALLLFPPGLDFVAAFLGCLYAGVVAVPAYPPHGRRSLPRLTAIAGDAAPRAVLTTAALVPRVRVWLDGGGAGAEAPLLVAADEVGLDAAANWRRPDLDAGTLAFLQYTSGSTAAPKGVRVTHANLLHNEEMIRHAFAQSEASVIVSWLPLYHDMGLIGGVLQPLYLGARCVLASPAAFLRRPRLWLEAIGRYRATTSGAPNFGYEVTADKVGEAERDGLDLGSWQVAFNGSEPVRPATLERFARAFAPCGFRAEAFYPCYGLAEATLFVSGGDVGAPPVVREVSAAGLEAHRAEAAAGGDARPLTGCGRSWLGQRLEVVDPQSRRPLPAGRVGEIWVAGPSVADGYWNRSEETERSFGARLAGTDGDDTSDDIRFLRTGDLGFLGADGELFVTGRSKDLIILRGRNVYPHDVELAAEAAHPALRRGCAAAFAVEADGEERLVVACEVERRFPADAASVAEVVEAVRQAVFEQHEAALHEVVLLQLGALPKTTSGKVRRGECRRRYLAGESGGRVAAAPAEKRNEPIGEGENAGRSGGGVAGAAAPPHPGGRIGEGNGDLPSRQELAALPADERLARLTALLADWVSALLRRDAPVPHGAPLTALGLESLSAAELQVRAEAELGVGFDYADLLEGATVAELAVRAAEALGGEAAVPEPFAARGARPAELELSHGQQALWFLQRLNPGSAAYHIAAAARVEGDLDAGALGRALAALAARHDQLRATFADRDGEPRTRVGAAPRVELVEEDAAEWDAGELRRRLRDAAHRPFDLAAGPLLRVVLFRGADGGDALVLAVHHLVADFWSLVVLVDELRALYAAELSGATAALPPPPAATYADVVAWQRRRLAGAEGERLERWWREALSDGAVADLDLPTDRPRPPVQTDAGDAVSAALGGALSAAVAALAAARGTTRFAVLLAGFQALLGRYTGQRDFLVGTPVAARRARELAGVVGYLVNPVVLRAALAGDPGLGELARRAAAAANAAFDHQDYPFPLLTERLRPVRDPSRSPLFQVFFSLQTPPAAAGRGREAAGAGLESLAAFALNAAGGRLPLGPATLASLPLERPPAQFDLNLMLAEGGDGLRATAVFNRDLFDRGTVERLLGHLAALLAAGAAEPERPLSDLPLLTAPERRQLVGDWDAARAPVPRPSLIHALFEAQADAAPERVAVAGEGRPGEAEEVTYGELERRANRLASRLRRLGVGPEVAVGVFLDRSPRMVEALLAVLKAGGAYLPLDPAYPEDRIAYTLADSGARVVVTEAAHAGALAGWDGTLLRLDADRAAIEAEAADRLPPTAGDGGAAYVIYTSGSTGRPKGVVVPHRPMVNFLASMARRPGIGPDDVFFSVTTLSFDIAGLELFGPLAVGARVVVAEAGTAADGHALAAALDAGGATLMQATPTTWRLLLDAGGPRDGAAPLTALCGGEALPRELAAALAPRVASLWNLYGPTETTVWSAVARVEAGEDGEGKAAAGAVSIGNAIANTRIVLLDRGGQPVPDGVPGELHVGGDGLARGYHRRPGLTAERFVPDPLAAAAGQPGARLYRTGDLARWRRGAGGGRSLDFLGRLDHQVKVRGVRIELGEIEAALASHPALARAVVATREPAPGDVRLVAWVVPAAGGDGAPVAVPDPAALRAFLAETLPEGYLPSRFVAVEALPLTPNGKVDRKALPEPEALRPGLATAFAAPRSELEHEVAALWCELLGVDRVGVEDNFFDLGGHSLLVSRLHARLVAAGHGLEMVELFRYPTVAALAGRLADGARHGGAAVRGEESARSRGAAASSASRDVAVIGYACRFPGASTPAELWRRLAAGEECITTFGDDELRAAGVDEALLADPAYVRAGAVPERPARFDAEFFGYTPREAELMDPQHRVFLECAWGALEDAGYDPRHAPGRVGVFAGVGLNTYLLHAGLVPGASMAGGYQAFVGNDKDFVPTRVSYELDLKGPSITVQTACSSSLVAVHLACQSLLAGESDVALAGGVTLRVPFAQGYLYEEGGIPSPDGHCRAFDAQAAGTVLGSGAGIVVLKPLAAALADGDTVRAVIKGSAINNDGAGKMGYTAPSVDGQAAAIAEAMAVARVAPHSVSYVEAHGTGTSLGDPIEVAALTEAFRGAGDQRVGHCALGSVKTNLGHLDTAAGIAGLIKTVLALEHGALPPSLHFDTPNPKIDFAGGPFRVVRELAPWHRNGTPRRAGVSSFGIGGTNAHVVLEEAPRFEDDERAREAARPWQLLVLSARSETALERRTAALAETLADAAPDLADAAWTLQVGRTPMAHRRALVAADAAGAAAVLAGGDPARLHTAVAAEGRRPVAFLLPGQGAQHPGAGRGLYETEAVFRAELDRLAELFAPHLGGGADLRELLVAADPADAAAAALLARTDVAQPALFAFELALARQWAAWGVEPAALLGHSLGEIVAATLAGVFEVEDAAALVAARGRLMAELPPGAMLGLELPAGADDDAEAWLAALAGRLPAAGELSLAAVNAARSWVVSGTAPAVDALAGHLAAEGVRHRRLHTSHAFHSAMMEPVLDRFAAEVARRPRHAPQVPLLSNLTGDWLSAEEAADPTYWARHLRRPVRFAAGLARLLEDPERVLLEVGPGRTLTQLCLPQAVGRTVVPSLPHPRDPQPPPAALAEAVGRLWATGAEIDWRGYAGDRRRRRVALPTYPFEGRDYLLPAAVRRAAAAAEAAAAEPAARRPDPADWYHVPLWRQTVPPADPAPEALAEAGPWLLLLDGGGVLAALAGRLRAAGAVVATAEAGDGFVALGGDEDGGGDYVLDPARRGDHAALAAALAAAGTLPRRVVHGLALGAAGADLPPAERARVARVAAFHSLLHLAAALEDAGATAGGDAAAEGAARVPRLELAVVSSGAAGVGGEAPARPERALLLGPVRALPQDVPGLACRSVDLDVPADGDAEALAADLLAELLAPAAVGERPDRVAWRGGRRWVEAFEPLRLDSGAGAALRDGGAYWLTGGLGGVGFALAEELASRHGAHLLITGRSELPPPEEWDALLAADAGAANGGSERDGSRRGVAAGAGPLEAGMANGARKNGGSGVAGSSGAGPRQEAVPARRDVTGSEAADEAPWMVAAGGRDVGGGEAADEARWESVAAGPDVDAGENLDGARTWVAASGRQAASAGAADDRAVAASAATAVLERPEPAVSRAVVDKLRRLRRLEEAGAEVIYVAADVADRGAMAAALARGEARFGRLDGVVHAAGLPGGGLAQTRTEAEAERVLAPKVDGALVLGDLLGGRLAAGSLDFLLFASSVNAVAGGFGQSDYAAANAFLDTYAEALPRRRGSRALAVAWDRWRGVGMAADATGDLLVALAGGGAGAAGAAADTELDTGGHPLLGRALGTAGGRRLWLGALTPERCWALAEHRVLGTPTLPGTSYLEMARAAFAETAPGRVPELSEVAFLAPLAVADGAARRLLTVLEPAGTDGGRGEQISEGKGSGLVGGAADGFGGDVRNGADRSGESVGSNAEVALAGDRPAFRFRVLSRGAGETVWTAHASGRVAAAPPSAGAGRRDLAALRRACELRELTAADVAPPSPPATAIANGSVPQGGGDDPFLVTGPRWQALKSLAVGECEGLARFELAAGFAADLDRMPLHPALLDVAAGAVRFLADGDYLPLAYERLTVYGPLPRAGFGHLSLHAAVEPGAGTLTCDVAVLDESGAERVVVRGFTMRRVDRDAARRLAEAAAAAPAAPAAAEDTTRGLSAAEGVESFRRALAAPAVARLVVTPRDLGLLCREVRRFDRDRVAAELAALSAPAPAAAAAQGGDGALEGDLERRIAAAWQRVLGVESVGAHDNFFELGGTSLAGIQLVAELKRELGTEIPTVAIFEAPTVAALARFLRPPEDAETATERAGSRADKKRQALSARRFERRPARHAAPPVRSTTSDTFAGEGAP